MERWVRETIVSRGDDGGGDNDGGGGDDGGGGGEALSRCVACKYQLEI